MKKQVIRLTEGELHRIIKESVNRVLNESKYPNPMGGVESRINAYPEYAEDWYEEEPLSPIPNKERLHTLDRTTDFHSNWLEDDHAYYADGEPYPSTQWCDGSSYSEWVKDGNCKLSKEKLDKMWKNQQERDKYEKMANSRPLHRKGSLNREL